jgi:hypothetical protein
MQSTWAPVFATEPARSSDCAKPKTNGRKPTPWTVPEILTVRRVRTLTAASLHCRTHNFAKTGQVAESVDVKKLIFFCSADPREDTGAFFRAYHFANVAAKNGLDAEVRFAGPAVDVTDLDTLPRTEAGDLIRQKIGESFDAKFEVSL